MPLVIKTEFVFFIACQVFLLSLLWAFVGMEYLLMLSHFTLWASVSIFENVTNSVALLAFACSIIYCAIATLLLKTERCYRVSALNCVLPFAIKFITGLVCGLIDLSIYETTSNNAVFKKTVVLGFFHVLSLSIQWAISDTSAYLVVLILAHVVYWAWFPRASVIVPVVCCAVALQAFLDEDKFANGSLMFTALSCLAVDVWSRNQFKGSI